MPTQQDVSKHYTHGNLVAAIQGGIESLGKAIKSVTVDDLAPVESFTSVAVRHPKIFWANSTLPPKTSARCRIWAWRSRTLCR